MALEPAEGCPCVSQRNISCCSETARRAATLEPAKPGRESIGMGFFAAAVLLGPLRLSDLDGHRSGVRGSVAPWSLAHQAGNGTLPPESTLPRAGHHRA